MLVVTHCDMPIHQLATIATVRRERERDDFHNKTQTYRENHQAPAYVYIHHHTQVVLQMCISIYGT